MKALLIVFWKVGGPFWTPNGITIQTKAPQYVIKIVWYVSLGALEISYGILNIHLKMNRLHTLLQCSVFHEKMAKDKDFFVVFLSFLKSIQIFNLPFFLGTTTMGDNHVASFIDWITPVTNSLLMSCLTIVA